MKKLLKITAYLLLLVIVIVGALIVYATTMLPNVGAAPSLNISKSPERIARGNYLANSVASCMDCHSTRDWTKFSGPLVSGTLGKGGEKFDRKFGFPGEYYSRNITPAGIDKYTDGELYRVITTGVTKEGRAMFPVMPYTHYAKMDTEDIYSIIAYLRSITPIENSVPESVSDFPMNIIINTIPQKASPEKRPDANNTVAYGAYLVNAAGCNECHTKAKNGQIIKELEYAGGRAFKMPDGSEIQSSNITSDKKTGIGEWTKEMFVNRFRAYADSGYVPHTVAAGAVNTIMPWTMYGTMTPADLSAIYEYLQSLAPISMAITKHTPAK
jgi:mono/diheme cytochrome c family protein